MIIGPCGSTRHLFAKECDVCWKGLLLPVTINITRLRGVTVNHFLFIINAVS